jgi:hypothetical protein
VGTAGGMPGTPDAPDAPVAAVDLAPAGESAGASSGTSAGAGAGTGTGTGTDTGIGVDAGSEAGTNVCTGAPDRAAWPSWDPDDEAGETRRRRVSVGTPDEDPVFATVDSVDGVDPNDADEDIDAEEEEEDDRLRSLGSSWPEERLEEDERVECERDGVSRDFVSSCFLERLGDSWCLSLSLSLSLSPSRSRPTDPVPADDTDRGGEDAARDVRIGRVEAPGAEEGGEWLRS